MKNVQKIIDLRGGMATLKQRPIRLEVPGFMRLVIEHVGRGPRGGELVSVAHYGEQNGDLMRDPEVVFEIADGQWNPISIQQDYIGSYREAVYVSEEGKVFVGRQNCATSRRSPAAGTETSKPRGSWTRPGETITQPSERSPRSPFLLQVPS